MKKRLVFSVLIAIILFGLSAIGYAHRNDYEIEQSEPIYGEETILVSPLEFPNEKNSMTTSPQVSLTPKPTKNPRKKIRLSQKEKNILVRIAMAEAEGEDLTGKLLVMNVVWNRVKSDSFPDSIEKVVFQENQFSPIQNGRYDKVTPNASCYKALERFQEGEDESQGALYFESESTSTWHRDNLTKLFVHGCHTFYAERNK